VPGQSDRYRLRASARAEAEVRRQGGQGARSGLHHGEAGMPSTSAEWPTRSGSGKPVGMGRPHWLCSDIFSSKLAHSNLHPAGQEINTDDSYTMRNFDELKRPHLCEESQINFWKSTENLNFTDVVEA
jgi:hypothetical protein